MCIVSSIGEYWRLDYIGLTDTPGAQLALPGPVSSMSTC